MKETGIVRRLDDFGRLVIPKEIRGIMGVQANDPFEIYLEDKDTVCFRRYKINLCDEIRRVQRQIDANSNLNQETQKRIASLLSEIQELIKDEE